MPNVNTSTQIDYFIDNKLLFPAFQPIVNLSTSKVYSYESLMRCQQQLNPIQLFQMAIQQNRLYELDTAGIINSVQAFSKLTNFEAGTLFLNVFPSTMLQDSFIPFIEKLMKLSLLPSASIVFELNESKEEDEIWEVQALKETVSILRNYGYKIALDDMGEGAASLKKIIKLEPDYIKMCKFFAENLANHSQKQKLLHALSNFCGEQIGMVLEGIETEEDMQIAKEIGISYGQGFFLGRPKTVITNK